MEYGRRICVLAFLFFVTFAATAQGDGKEGAVPYKELKKHIPAECRGLHKVGNIDDLLLQMHENVNSLCLFKIKETTLESVWGIPIFNLARISEEDGKVRDDNILKYDYLYDKYPLFFITKSKLRGTDYEALSITKSDSYFRNNLGFGGSLREGSFPKLLPKPIEVFRKNEANTVHLYPPLDLSEPVYYISPNTVYKPYYYYYWNNEKRDPNLPVLILRTDYISAPIAIFLSSNSSIIDELPTTVF